MRVTSDDEVYRVRTVWLGPRGLTLPWTARYQAYGTFLGLLTLILAVEAVTPLQMGIPPVWELCGAALGTYAVMAVVDYERPLGAHVRTVVGETRRGLAAWLARRPPVEVELTLRAVVARPPACPPPAPEAPPREPLRPSLPPRGRRVAAPAVRPPRTPPSGMSVVCVLALAVVVLFGAIRGVLS